MSEPLKPSPALLCKLGSIVVHADEMLSSDGHAFDQHAIRALLADARAAVDAHLVSLLARLTAAERYEQALRDIAEWAEIETGRAGRIPAHRVAEKARAALPPAGDTRGEQTEQEQAGG